LNKSKRPDQAQKGERNAKSNTEAYPNLHITCGRHILSPLSMPITLDIDLRKKYSKEK